MDVSNAIKIFAQFERTKQFWSYVVPEGMIDKPRDFIRPVPHLSFVHGEKMVNFLRARHAAMQAHPFFSSMAFSTDRTEIARWAPLLTEERAQVPIAATKMDSGTDVDFGVVSRKLLAWLARQPRCAVSAGQRVVDLNRTAAGWDVAVKDVANGSAHRTSIPACSMVDRRCSLAPSLPGRPNYCTAREVGPTRRAPSVRTTSRRSSK